MAGRRMSKIEVARLGASGRRGAGEVGHAVGAAVTARVPAWVQIGTAVVVGAVTGSQVAGFSTYLGMVLWDARRRARGNAP